MVSLADEVELAGKETLRKVESKEGSADEEEKDVAEMVTVANVNGLVNRVIRRQKRQKERQIGEDPEDAAWRELQESLHWRIRSFESGLSQTVEQAAESALNPDGW